MERVLTFGVGKWSRLTPMLLVMLLAAKMNVMGEATEAAAVVDFKTTIAVEATPSPLMVILVLGPVGEVVFAGVLASLVESSILTNQMGDLI